MKGIRNLTLSLALTAFGIATAATPDAPVILQPYIAGGHVIHGLSNNGKYGVASISPGEDGFSYTVGAVFYDLTGNTPVGTNISGTHKASGANDVTDDGLIVVGSADNKPALCRYSGGKWTWETLPVVDKTIEIEMEDMYTGEVSIGKFKMNGGEVKAVTPDGKYGVGVCRSNEYEMLEVAVMWDIPNKQIVEVGSPVTDLGGLDQHQSRYMRVSDDGRYLLCWNSFSYMESVVFVYDRQKKKAQYINYIQNADGSFSPRLPKYNGGLDMDGISKSLTSDGHYVTGGILVNDNTYPFIYDVWNDKLDIHEDGINTDMNGWSITKEGVVLGASPANTLYADAYVCYKGFSYPFQTLYRDVYGMNKDLYGIENTGKPTLVSDDGRTIVFVTERDESYVARFQENLVDALGRVNLLSNWSVYPDAGSRMTRMQSMTFTFDNPVEADASRYADIKVKDSKGDVAGTAKSGGIRSEGMKLYIDFNTITLKENETYTVTIPDGFCHLKGHDEIKNGVMEVKYTGRPDVPVTVKSIDPVKGTALANLDLNDNPVVVTFDAPVKINGTDSSRPIAHLYVDDNTEAAAPLVLDVDKYTNRLVIFPSSTYYLYKGSKYRIDVPAGAVTDLSGAGPSAAFSVEYEGSFVPQLGDEKYVFNSRCDDFSPFLVYEGDNGVPTPEYADMGFTYDSTPWWVVMDEGVEDMAFASHSCYVDGRQANDWLVTRMLHLPSDVTSYLSFQGQSYRNNKNDVLKVYIFEYNNTLNQLTSLLIDKIRKEGELVFDEKLSPGKTEDRIKDEWTDYVIPLDKYAGKNIYICFVNENKNQSMVMIDNVTVVKNISTLLTVRSETNVVNKKTAPVKGVITIESELVYYKNINMTLLDADGKEISKISQGGLDLKAGDVYDFAFPQELPLKSGETNSYTIKYSLDDDNMTYEGVIRNLTFEPYKRVLLEEYTGRDCQFCPLGLAALERLETIYGDRLIPVALHAFSGSDPKGYNILDYAAAVFMNSTAAPNGRINRRPNLAAPMYSDENNKYHLTAADVPGTANTWQDEIVAEFAEVPILDIQLRPETGRPGFITYTATVKSALNIEDQNIRVLGLLLEDKLVDRQTSGVHNLTDPLIGEFGKGGVYGTSSFIYQFNNVARGYWGGSYNGAARLIPTKLEANKEYNVTVDMCVADIVDKPENIKMVVVLIDENTGRVINAAVEASDITGIEEIPADEMAATLEVGKVGNEIVVASAGETAVTVYGLDGRVLKTVYGHGNFSFSLEGQRGMVIVNAVSGGSSVARKFVF